MPVPVVLLVNGLPGSGTSTLAAQLSTGPGIALFSKDAYKGSLWDSDRPPTAAESSRIGRAAVVQRGCGDRQAALPRPSTACGAPRRPRG